MGKQNIAIGAADQGNGDTLFDAFTAVVSNTNEVYEGANITATAPLEKTSVADTSVTLSIADNGIGATQLNVADNGTPGWLLSSDGDGSFTWVAGVEGDITAVTAGDGLSGGGTAGPVILDLSVDDSTIEISGDAAQIKDLGVTTDKLANDGVTHAKLEDRYTAIQDIATTTGTIDLEADKYAAFNLTGNLGTVTLDIHDIKTGQVIDIILSGADLSSAAITLDASVPFTTVSINKVGSTSIDTAAKNIIQVLCVDDTVGDAILTWAVASYVTGTTV